MMMMTTTTTTIIMSVIESHEWLASNERWWNKP